MYCFMSTHLGINLALLSSRPSTGETLRARRGDMCGMSRGSERPDDQAQRNHPVEVSLVTHSCQPLLAVTRI